MEVAGREVEGIPFADVPDDELSDGQLLEKYRPLFLGPTWKRDELGAWVLPERTLGWQIARWCSEWLKPLGDTELFEFTLEQLRFLLWWYAVDERGEFVYRHGVLQRIKGWGKDPFLAVICLIEAFGPCRFGGWLKGGVPFGVPCRNAWVELYALSKEQTENTFTMFPILVSERMRKRYGMDVKLEIVRGLGNTVRIVQKTASFRSTEGGRVTFSLLNETQHWLASNRGHQLKLTIDGNASKGSGARYVAITNAYKPGEDSVAQRDREAYEGFLEGRALDQGLLYDSIEAPSHTPLTERVFRVVYNAIRGDSVWCDWHKAWLSTLDPTRPVSESRRMYLNQVWQPEGSLYKAAEWDRLRVDETLEPGDRVCLGFDGGKSDDATALVAIRCRDQLIVPLLVEEKPEDLSTGWEVNRERVDSAVHRAFREYKVVGFFADVALWESYIHEWTLDYGHLLVGRASERGPIEFDMRGSQKKVVRLHEQFMSAVLEQRVHHGGSEGLQRALRRHVLNAVRRDTTYGVTFQKESRESPKKVDLYAAAMLAFGALMEVELTEAAQKVDVSASPLVFGSWGG